MSRAERHIAALGIFIHGVLTLGHAIGLVHNLKRRNWFDVAAHSFAMGYDLWATKKHMKQLEDR